VADKPSPPEEYAQYGCRQSRNSTLAELDPGKPWTAEVNRPYPRSDGAFPEAMQQFLTLPLSDDARRKILWENARGSTRSRRLPCRSRKNRRRFRPPSRLDISLASRAEAGQRIPLFEDNRPQSQFVGGERPGQAGDAGSENDDVPGIA
jgi:hypothetical protein